MDADADADAARAARAARREFVRASHPDRGGDTEQFMTGLAALDRAVRPVEPAPSVRVVVVPTRSWRHSLFAPLVRRARRRTAPARVK